MCAQRVQLKTTINGQQVPLNPYTDCVKNVRQIMPLAGSQLLGTTILYVGPQTDKYNPGVCYTCQATQANSYYWASVSAPGFVNDTESQQLLLTAPNDTRFSITYSDDACGLALRSADGGHALQFDGREFKVIGRQWQNSIGGDELFYVGAQQVRAFGRTLTYDGQIYGDLTIKSAFGAPYDAGRLVLGNPIEQNKVQHYLELPVADTGEVIRKYCNVYTADSNYEIDSGLLMPYYTDNKYISVNGDTILAEVNTNIGNSYGTKLQIYGSAYDRCNAMFKVGAPTFGYVGFGIDQVYNAVITSQGLARGIQLVDNLDEYGWATGCSKFVVRDIDMTNMLYIAGQYVTNDQQMTWDYKITAQIYGKDLAFHTDLTALQQRVTTLQSAGGSAARSIFDMYYALSSETPPGAMSLEKGTLIENCDQVFPDFWSACLQRRGNTHMFPQFNGNFYYYWSGANVIGDQGINGFNGNAVCYYNGKIYVLADTQCDGHPTPPPQSWKWRQFVVPTEQWDAQRSYSIGDTVLYNGQIWCARSYYGGPWEGVGIAPGSQTEYPYSWALYDLPTQVVAPSIRILTESEWQVEVTANGSCGAFVVDEEAKSVRLPKISYKPVPEYNAYIQIYSEAIPASTAQAAQFINMLDDKVSAAELTTKADKIELSRYLPLSGGNLTGAIAGIGSTSGIQIYAGANNFDGATLQLFQRNYGTYAGQFYLRASTKSSSGDTTSGVNSCDLIGKPDGTLTWDGVSVLNPIGTVIAFAGNSAPTGYLICNGAEVSRTTYAKLFAVIGTTYGAGDGSTTFNLPNLTDKFIMGSGTAGTSKTAGLPNITGDLKLRPNNTGYNTFFGFDGVFNMGSSTTLTADAFIASTGKGTTYIPITFAASRSSSIYGNSTTVQPPAVTMRFYIKY